VTALSDEAKEAIARAQYVVVSLPEVVALHAAEGILAAMDDSAVWIDLVAVKGRIVDVLSRARTNSELLSIHPIFAPQSGFGGQTTLVVDVRCGGRSKIFVALLEKWGASVTYVDARTHDRHLASVQAATHAALLAFGSALGALDYDAERGIALGTKPHRLLVTLLARVLAFNPDAYWEVQESNPHAKEARAALRRGLDELERLVEGKDIEGFRRRFAASSKTLEPKLEGLAADCTRIFKMLGPTKERASLEDFRRELDELDTLLLQLLGNRLDICREVATFKRSNGIPMMQQARVESVKQRAAERGLAHGLDPAFTTRIYEAIIAEACRVEDAIIAAPVLNASASE
jgi:prephenate dehydrogenase